MTGSNSRLQRVGSQCTAELFRPLERRQAVVRHVGGRTTEVLNTDAEGRMVLADGLAYARLELGATVLVEDTAGRGHTTRVVGDEDVLALFVRLPD